MLIQISETRIINSDYIDEAHHCGNYTDIFLNGGFIVSLWDEDKKIWNKIARAAEDDTSS